jgi:Dolichyl-phosphate-mannose-protein mannosyltransferase
MNKSRLPRLLLTTGILCFLVLSVALMWAKAPWWDEGFLAGPPANLAANGFLGAHVLSFLFPSADRYLYWNMPAYFVVLTAWFKAFGFGVMEMRSLSMVCGLAALASWYVIVVRLLDSHLAAALTVLLLSTDYAFVTAAITARMDMMTAALGLAGFAGYLCYRETNLSRAVLLGATGTAGAIFCHPLGMVYAGVIFISAIYFDWRRIRVKHLGLALIPFVVFGSLWAIYILQAPSVFLAQMHKYSGRFQMIWNPVQLVNREITGRYLRHYLEDTSRADLPRLARLRVLGLFPYVAGFLLAVSSRSLRSTAGGRLLILLVPVSALLLALGDFAQYPMYFVHALPFAMAALAAGLAYYWQSGKYRAYLLALLVCVLAVGIGGLGGKVLLNDYRNIYLSTVRAIVPDLKNSGLVDGPCELIFGIGDSRLVDGMTRESYFAHKPDFIVIGRVTKVQRFYEPEHYELTYRNRDYSVYRAK